MHANVYVRVVIWQYYLGNKIEECEWDCRYETVSVRE